MRLILTVAIWFSALGAFAADSAVNETVEKLLKAVETSNATFIRNGDEHTGKAAADHMRKKYEHFKKKIKTPEDFIERAATKSELSGKPYKIKTPDGTLVESREWMLARLAEMRKRP